MKNSNSLDFILSNFHYFSPCSPVQVMLPFKSEWKLLLKKFNWPGKAPKRGKRGSETHFNMLGIFGGNRKHLKILIDAIPNFVFIKSGDGRWFLANEGAQILFQVNEGEYQNKSDFDLIESGNCNKQAVQVLNESENEVWNTRETTILEKVLSTPDGEFEKFEVMYVPIYKKDGSRHCMVILGDNITEREFKDQLLLHSGKLSAVGELAAGIAHEIRNPLTSLKGFIQLMRGNNISTQLYVQYFNVMLEELERINSIIGELLLLAKPNATFINFINPRILIENVISLLSGQANMESIQIQTNFAIENVFIKGDENKLKQVFINIIKNGMEAMENGGEIFIELFLVSDDFISIRCIDQGYGMLNEHIKKVGTSFFTTKEKGTGLGLFITKKIVEDHKGKLFIHSEPGKGTVVEVLLPVSNF